MDVPSILIVAPNGIVKDEIFLETPIFSAKVSIFIGIVALDVDVEKQSHYWEKFLIKIIGFNPLKKSF